VGWYSIWMKRISYTETVTAEEHQDLQRLYFLQMHKVVDLQEENILLHGLVTELRSKRKMKA